MTASLPYRTSPLKRERQSDAPVKQREHQIFEVRAADHPTKSHAGWKCDMTTAMAKDQIMRRVDVAIAALVLQRSNQYTKVSIVPDHLLAKELECNRATFTEFRKRGTAAGYFDCILGRSGQATIYKWKNDRLHEIQNMFLDRRILKQEESIGAEKDRQNGSTVRRRKLSVTAASSVKKTNHCGSPIALRKPSTRECPSAQKTTHRDSAKRVERNTRQCLENQAHSAERAKHLHSYYTLEDSLPEEGRDSRHTREALDQSDHEGWTEEDWQARFDEIAGYLESDEGLPRHEAEHRARMICG